METASTNKNNTRPGYSYVDCRNCGDEIYFGDNHLSRNGKKVPLSKRNDKPHQYPNWFFHKGRSVNADPIRIDTTDPLLAEILRIVKKIEKCIIDSSLSDDSTAVPDRE